MELIKKTHAWDSWYFFHAPVAMYEARRKARMAWLELRHMDDDSEATRAHKDVKSKEAFAQFQHREWFLDLRSRFALHPVVEHLVKAYRPNDWQQLLLEHPHISTSDPNRLAYTRDEAAGKADRQTVTSVGKYIKRHWPALPDHVLRDAAALYVPDQIEHGTGIQFLIRGVEFGPRSCMQSGYGSIPFGERDNRQLKSWLGNPEDNDEPRWDRHPYAVYVPEFGWGMAIRTSEGQVLGRCLTWTDPDDASRKVFVRSYARNKGGDLAQSGSDHTIESWLRERGFVKRDGWPAGAKFAQLCHPNGDYLMPYIDGSTGNDRKVSEGWDDERKVSYFYRDPDGDYLCDNTNGSATHEDDDEDDEDYRYCEDCDTRVHYEYTYHVGREEDRCVCDSCINDYTMVRGSRRSWSGRSRGSGYSEYYIPQDDAQPVYSSCINSERGCEDYYVDPEHLPDDVVSTYNDGYAELDDTVRCTDDEYYFTDDPCVVELAEECPSTGANYATKDDAWKDGDGNWHSDRMDYVEIDGAKYPEDDCWQCDGTGLWHRDDEDYVEDDYGNKYAKCFFDRVSSDAEWGDELTAEVREMDFDLHAELIPVEATTPPDSYPTVWEHPGQTPEAVADLLAAAKSVLTEAFALAA